MPLPPPPAEALTSNGYPTFSPAASTTASWAAAPTAAASVATGVPFPLDGGKGTPVSAPAAADPARPTAGESVAPGTTGTPAASIRRRASILEPIDSMAAGGGPTQISPAFRQAS